MMEQSVSYKMLKILTGFVLLVAIAGVSAGSKAYSENDSKPAPDEMTWIIQWKEEPPEQFRQDSEIRTYYPDSKVTVARPKQSLDEEEWISRWKEHMLVLSFQLNQRVKAAKAPNDPLIYNQKYLQQIGAESAWNITTNYDAIIAVVDTGVDRNHPDLSDRLLPGFNLVNPGTPPDDDNGHGTNVAGVLAALANNDKGTAGLLWNARIMPIKALESDGNGDEDKLGEGIRYAMQNGAKIVVLSLGLNKYSAYMENIVKEAEEQGVLLVAASGNEGNAVKYPAAYDTVLAVGGVAPDNKPERMSNNGPELDIVAPWVVFTTSLGGGYDYQDGTSMAAPQAAAVAALAWSVHSGMEPWEIRNLLRQTAQDLGSKGWDKQSGYGLLRADRALRETPKRDLYEPNDHQAVAQPISSNKSVMAFAESGEEDWYYWDAPYDGSASYKLTGSDAQLQLTHVSEATRADKLLGTEVYSPVGAMVDVKKGRHYVKVSRTSRTGGSRYGLHVDYSIYPDAFEDNDRQYKAYMLPARSQMLTGTFDHYQDQDWYSIQIEQTGSLKLKLTPDTARIDPVLSFFRRGEREVTIDHNGDSQSEAYEWNVKPGLYYIKAANVSSYAYPVTGEYMLDLHLATQYEDPYEPNDKSYQATVLNFGDSYFGVIDPSQDTDWYRIRLDGESLLHLELSLVPEPDGIQIQLMDAGLRLRTLSNIHQEANLWTAESKQPAGTYYVKVSSSSGQRQQLYGLRVHANRMVEGYSDIYAHWAEPQMVKLVQSGFVNGYGGYELRPDRPVTRAEAAVLLDRILGLSAAAPPEFEDISADHWAYPAVARLSRSGIVNGYSRTAFAPDRNISRMEMMTMLANATGKKGTSGGGAPFYDVTVNYWGTPILRQLKAEGWAEGYEDGSFRPERLASRAEFMAITVKMLGL
jgi:hypothetical protein